MKQCNKCKELKTRSEFYKNRAKPDGLQYICKDCDRIRRRKQTQKDWNMPDRAARMRKNSRQYQQRRRNDRAAYEEYKARYADSRKRAVQKYQEGNKIKARAKDAVTMAIRANRLFHISTQICQDCGGQAENYHHWSYSEEHWLDVIPLCIKCHNIRHRKT